MLVERRDEAIDVVADGLEPQLARLMNDDEQQFVRMLGLRTRLLQFEQRVEVQV